MINKINASDLMWVAGILEGEGSFYFTQSKITIEVSMTDEDVVHRFGEIVGFGSIAQKKNLGRDKRVTSIGHRWSGVGFDAYELGVEIFPIMGKRRQEQIKLSWTRRLGFELSSTATGNNIRRIFTTDSGELLPHAKQFFI